MTLPTAGELRRVFVQAGWIQADSLSVGSSAAFWLASTRPAVTERVMWVSAGPRMSGSL
jgi:hypothetical protein